MKSTETNQGKQLSIKASQAIMDIYNNDDALEVETGGEITT